MPKKDDSNSRREKGSGSVYQRKDGTWLGRYSIGVKPNGKPDVKCVYAKTESECKKKLKEIVREANSNNYVYIQKESVQFYMDRWLKNVKANDLKPKSYDRLEETLTDIVYPYIGNIQLQALNSDDVQNMINDLRKKGKSLSTIKKAYDAVNACFKRGVATKTVASNPCAAITLPNKKLFPAKKICFYTEEEAAILIDQALSCWPNGTRRYPLGSFVPLLINTGLRMGELLALQWDKDIDFENTTLTVHNNVSLIRDRDAEVDDKKKFKLIVQDSVKTDAGQDRTIPLNEQALAALEDLKSVTGKYDFVMTTRNGTHVSPRNIDRIFRRIATAAGFEEDKIYGIHSLRHTFATLLLSNDVEIKTVSELLGHSDITITYNTYIHVIKAQKIKAVDSIPKLVK